MEEVSLKSGLKESVRFELAKKEVGKNVRQGRNMRKVKAV